jgi:hypothetical protein
VNIEHPPWCELDRCTATQSSTGAHLSVRADVQDSVLAAWMYAPAGQPDQVSVQVSRMERLMSPHEAYRLGRILMSLGRAVRKADRSAGGHSAGPTSGSEPDQDEIDRLIGRTQRLLVDWHRNRR